ncbi:farnesol dehydrogenase-like isoform 2-T5 [Cochliomyia hominivorax]
MKKWHNKIAVVTGAGAGIGAACCKALIENDMILVGLDKRQELVEQLRDLWPNDRCHALKCDVRNEKDVVLTFEKIAEQYGDIAVLINNAGIARNTQLIKENNTKDLLDTLETNIMGVTYCTREAFKIMSRKNNNLGQVIIMNSVAGHKIPIHFKGLSTNMYAASKHALNAITKIYRNEFLSKNANIKITSISPGLVRTNIFPDQAWDIIKDLQLLEPSDVADAVIYCLKTPPHVEISELILEPFAVKF